MNNTITSLDKSLSIIIDGATEKGAKLVDFLYAQAPDVIQQLLIYHGVESAAKCLLGLILVFGFPFIIVFICKKYYQVCKDKLKLDNDEPGIWVPMTLFVVFSLLISQMNGWDLINLTWLKICIAPKIYLLEFLTQIGK